MAEKCEASFKTCEPDTTISTLEASPRTAGKEDDDEAVISLLEIDLANENGRTGKHAAVDTTGGAYEELGTNASPCSNTATVNQHITTSITAPGQETTHNPISNDTVGYLPASTEDIEHVRSSCSTSIQTNIGETPSTKSETNAPVSPLVDGSTPSNQHAPQARPLEVEEASLLGDPSEKCGIVPDAGNMRIPGEAGVSQIVESASATEDLPAVIEDPVPEISSTRSYSSDVVKPHLEDEDSIHLDSPISGSALLPSSSDDIIVHGNLVSPSGAYTQPSESAAIPSEPGSAISSLSELDTPLPVATSAIQPSSITNTSIAAAFPLTFKHYHVFALPTAQPASPHEESLQSAPSVSQADFPSAASVYGATVLANDELTAASAPTTTASTELSVLDVDDCAMSIPGPFIYDSTALADNPPTEDANQERVLLDHATSTAKSDFSTAPATAHGQDHTHPLLPTPTAYSELVLTSASSICVNVDTPVLAPTSASTSEINEETSAGAVENIDADLDGTPPIHEDAFVPSTAPQESVLHVSTEAITQECVRETSPEHLAATFEDAAHGPFVDLSDNVDVVAGSSVDLQPENCVLSQPLTGFDSAPIVVDSIISPSPVTETSTESNAILEEKYPAEGTTISTNVAPRNDSPLSDIPPVPNPSAAHTGMSTEVVEEQPRDSIEEECFNINADEVERSETAASLDSHGQDCPDPLFAVLPSSSPPSSQDPVSELIGSPTTKNDEEELVRDEMDLDDMLPPSSPVLSSSQPRASSPDRIFDSSPPDLGGYSPLSSPQPFSTIDDKEDSLKHGFSLDAEIDGANHDRDDVSGSIVLRKRKLEDEHSDNHVDLKKFKPEITLTLPPPPNPKRPTQASQKRQFKKLVKPFRSPLVNIGDVLAGKDAVYASGRARSRTPGPGSAAAAGASASCPSTKEDRPKEEQIDTSQLTVPVANKDRTAKVAKPFRAPSSSLPGTATTQVTAASTSTIASAFGGGRVQAAPTIQTLQARVQKLKQAIKIKQGVHDDNGSDGSDKLEVLTRKWRGVGREVAWLVWDSVKDLEPGVGVGRLPAKGGWDEGESPFSCGGGDGGKMKKGGFDDRKGGHSSGWGISSGWGWDEKEGKSGEDVMEVEEEKNEEEDEQDVPEHTLGTMLRHMGIDPDTLGWIEDEGDFVDIDDE